MTAPHFHTTKEAKAAIKKIEHNHGQAAEGHPLGIMGGSAGNQTTITEGVTDHEKGGDWVHNRGIKPASGGSIK
jgi:hypothetical protein